MFVNGEAWTTEGGMSGLWCIMWETSRTGSVAIECLLLVGWSVRPIVTEMGLTPALFSNRGIR